MAHATSAEPAPTRKRTWIAVVLQCIPILGMAGCAANGLTDQSGTAEFFAFVAWWSVLFWGLGYQYVGAKRRFAATCIVGPIFALSSCFGSFKGVTLDYEHQYNRPSRSDIASANAASFQEALILGGAVLLLAVDAWRLVDRHNQALTSVERVGPDDLA